MKKQKKKDSRILIQNSKKESFCSLYNFIISGRIAIMPIYGTRKNASRGMISYRTHKYITGLSNNTLQITRTNLRVELILQDLELQH